jgi:hypothetical protein
MPSRSGREGPDDVLQRRGRPPCDHEWLRECPLTVRDWEEVFYAMLAYRAVCRSVSIRAHTRAALDA